MKVVFLAKNSIFLYLQLLPYFVNQWHYMNDCISKICNLQVPFVLKSFFLVAEINYNHLCICLFNIREIQMKKISEGQLKYNFWSPDQVF